MEASTEQAGQAPPSRLLEERTQRLAAHPHLSILLERQIETATEPPVQRGVAGVRPVPESEYEMFARLMQPSLAQPQRQRPRREGEPVIRRRIDRDPTETLDTRRHAMNIMNSTLQEISQLCVRVLRQQQPLVESRIQNILEQQERLAARPSPEEGEEDDRVQEAERLESELAVSFSQMQQIPEDISTIRPLYNDRENEVTVGQMRTLFRVFESVYFDMQSAIAEEEEEEDDEEMPPLEEDIQIGGGVGGLLAAMMGLGAVGNRGGGGGLGGGLDGAAGLGMAAALLGVASGLMPPQGLVAGMAGGMSQNQMQRMVERLGLPADFFANVPVPMQEETLQAMPSTAYQAVEVPQSKPLNSECNICMMPFEPEDMVRLFPCCNVVQHTECLERWFQTHDTCLVCRQKVGDQLAAPEEETE